MSCDPQACRALQRHGFPAGELEVLRGPKSSPLGSDVIVATAAVRRELGGRLTARYAPVVVARFGSGAARVDIRAVAPQGAAAYRSALQADRAARRAAGAQLLHSRRVLVSAAARRQLSAGLVDSRLMITVAALAAGRPLYIIAFSDSGPGAAAGVPLRFAELTGARTASRDSTATERFMIAFLHGQPALYRAARAEMARLPGGRWAVRIEFAAPSPLGLLAGPKGRREASGPHPARKSSRAGFTTSACVQAMLCGPPSTVTKCRSLISPGSRAAVLG